MGFRTICDICSKLFYDLPTAAVHDRHCCSRCLFASTRHNRTAISGCSTLDTSLHRPPRFRSAAFGRLLAALASASSHTLWRAASLSLESVVRCQVSPQQHHMHLWRNVVLLMGCSCLISFSHKLTHDRCLIYCLWVVRRFQEVAHHHRLPSEPCCSDSARLRVSPSPAWYSNPPSLFRSGKALFISAKTNKTRLPSCSSSSSATAPCNLTGTRHRRHIECSHASVVLTERRLPQVHHRAPDACRHCWSSSHIAWNDCLRCTSLKSTTQSSSCCMLLRRPLSLPGARCSTRCRATSRACNDASTMLPFPSFLRLA